MHVEITSFGYGHGPAPSADLGDEDTVTVTHRDITRPILRGATR